MEEMKTCLYVWRRYYAGLPNVREGSYYEI
jgi:hypothetical protein